MTMQGNNWTWNPGLGSGKQILIKEKALPKFVRDGEKIGQMTL